ncbi:thioesterase family protein [Yimella sp. cx-51]|uniref:acyl-CoA thioesterase n=1 Tax=Yimella sp. cx-51 TaxID=2770551 RepID=UPI00165E8093|nr:acyl-CoA thioesterase [Yimella sp. cx-51]MBC9957123.1 acyl-CoA thioesterase [Yimella sp. cx-51]QTH37221.1 acyl-CoA thioesterase [Yimella sp. cx-51]
MPKRPYYVDVPLRWSDMDANRHVNNVQFLRLLEEARVLGMREWFGDLGHDKQPLLVARSEIDYLQQLPYRGPTITIAMWVSRIAAASFDLAYEVLSSREEDATVYARSEGTLVTFDMEMQRPSRISAETKADLEKYLGEPVPMKRRDRR